MKPFLFAVFISLFLMAPFQSTKAAKENFDRNKVNNKTSQAIKNAHAKVKSTAVDHNTTRSNRATIKVRTNPAGGSNNKAQEKNASSANKTVTAKSKKQGNDINVRKKPGSKEKTRDQVKK